MLLERGDHRVTINDCTIVLIMVSNTLRIRLDPLHARA